MYTALSMRGEGEPSSGPLDQTDHQQNDDRADRRMDDCADNAGDWPEAWQQQPGNDCSDHADDDITDEPEILRLS